MRLLLITDTLMANSLLTTPQPWQPSLLMMTCRPFNDIVVPLLRGSRVDEEDGED